MSRQKKAEQEKREQVTHAEAAKESAIINAQKNKEVARMNAEAKRDAASLNAEASRIAVVQKAEAERQALILKAEADDGVHRFTLVSLERIAAPIYYETNAITSKTSEEKLIKNRIKTFGNRLYLKDPYYYITDYGSFDNVYIKEGMIINGTCVNDKPHVYQPLEKE